VPLLLGDAAAALLCDELNGQPLTAASGAPWRLVVPGGACFTSVKWVSHLELTAEAGEASGERIARARLPASLAAGVARTEDTAS
jgi:DMSO/TMAO reductase YedYZ molybdopterin-dependent catalytic subunit